MEKCSKLLLSISLVSISSHKSWYKLIFRWLINTIFCPPCIWLRNSKISLMEFYYTVGQLIDLYIYGSTRSVLQLIITHNKIDRHHLNVIHVSVRLGISSTTVIIIRRNSPILSATLMLANTKWRITIISEVKKYLSEMYV